jgi:hypothetical protein
MAEQIRVVRHALIGTLGLYVPPFLAPLSPDLRGWLTVETTEDINDDNALFPRVTFKREGWSATVVALTHPSQYQANVRHRRY